MVFPSFKLRDVEDMSLREIDKRITFFNKTKYDQKNVELKTFMSLIYSTVSFANSPDKQRNSKFSKFLNKTFNKNNPYKDETYNEVMNTTERNEQE